MRVPWRRYGGACRRDPVPAGSFARGIPLDGAPRRGATGPVRASALRRLTARGRFRSFASVKSATAPRRRPARASSGDCEVVYVDEGRVTAARAAAPPGEVLERVAERFSALSDPTRLRILHALGRAELCVCDLSKVAGRSMPATSQQLRLLRRLGLVRFRAEGKLAYYRLASAWVRDALRTALDAEEAP